jgi:lipopolysaccharide transport system permease protein
MVVLMGESPHWWALAFATAGGLLVAWFGHAWFVTTQRGFADVL